MTIHFGDSTSITTATGLGAKIGQVLSTIKTDTDSYSQSSESVTGFVSNFSQSITTTGSNKVLITGHISIDTNSGNYYNSIGVLLFRTDTEIGQGDSNNNRRRVHVAGGANAGYYSGNRGPESVPIHFLDSPSAGTHTYRVKLGNQYAANVTLYVNRGGSDANSITRPVTSSVLTCTEIIV